MKDCTQFQSELSVYASGELTGSERLRLDNHLAHCADCRAEEEREQQLRESLTGLPQVKCPDHVVEAIMAQTGLTTRSKSQQRPWTWVSIAVAATLAVLFLPGLNGVLVSDAPNDQVAISEEFTAAEIAQAKHDVIATLALAADVMARSRESTMSDVFGTRLPNALSGSLSPMKEPPRTDAQSDRLETDHNTAQLGGNG